jgi:AcrR family transcriptional regulator
MRQAARQKTAPTRGSAAETRRRLLSAGQRAFAAKGLGGTNLREDILAVSGVSAGSFYHQFTDKAELLLALLDVDFSRLGDLLERGLDSSEKTDVAGAIRMIFDLYFDLADKNPYFIKIYVREYYSDDARVRRKIQQHNDATTQHLASVLGRLNETGGLEIDAALGSMLLGSLVISSINFYVGLPAKERARQRERLISGLVALLDGGLGAVRLAG